MATHHEPHAAAVAAQLLGEIYPQVACVGQALQEMPESSLEEGYLAFRLRALATSDSPVLWVLRAHHCLRRIPEHFRYFYPWACRRRESVERGETPEGRHNDNGTCDMEMWLKTRAATLTCLEELAYPSPRVVPTRDGAPVGMAHGWCVLVTTFVAGTVLTPTRAQVRLMGSALGRLHALPLPAAERVGCNVPSVSSLAPGLSYWHPQHAIPSGLARLRATAGDVPSEWQPWHAAFEQTMEQMQQAGLPMHLIHGDAWSANAVIDPEERASLTAAEAILIDWDQGGQGPAMADLGRLLLECHLSTELPIEDALAWHIAPDPRRIEAVVEGYAQHRIPSPAELDALLLATRFGVAFIGALHLDQALHAASTDPAWVAGMERRFARLQNRYNVSEEIVALAIAQFERVRTTSG
jgi:Ser/Thr protein kinase RdoA (MazF antagonist)